jgi:outer membrane receptor for Fe3+-dicitrate
MIKLISNPTQLFVGEKRERAEYVGSGEAGGWRRKTHEWLFNVVSGTGAKKNNPYTQDN